MTRDDTILFRRTFSKAVWSCDFDGPNGSALAVRAQRIETRFKSRRKSCVFCFYTFSLESRRFGVSATGGLDREHGRGPTAYFVTTPSYRRKRTGDA